MGSRFMRNVCGKIQVSPELRALQLCSSVSVVNGGEDGGGPPRVVEQQKHTCA